MCPDVRTGIVVPILLAVVLLAYFALRFVIAGVQGELGNEASIVIFIGVTCFMALAVLASLELTLARRTLVQFSIRVHDLVYVEVLSLLVDGEVDGGRVGYRHVSDYGLAFVLLGNLTAPFAHA
jgi:hypothetical protein